MTFKNTETFLEALKFTKTCHVANRPYSTGDAGGRFKGLRRPWLSRIGKGELSRHSERLKRKNEEHPEEGSNSDSGLTNNAALLKHGYMFLEVVFQ